MHKWEISVLVVAVALLTALALVGMGRVEREAYQNFLRRAPMVQKALEHYARDHEGRFPPDAMFTYRPQGITEQYIDWDREWNIDYEVRGNGEGGQFVCLEFCGPYQKRRYYGLCNNPKYRAKYGRGEAIPGTANRIWMIRESAPIMPKEPRR